MDYLHQLQHLHWALWASIGFMMGLGMLLVAMRLWDSWKGNPTGTTYQAAFQQRLKTMSGRLPEVYIATDCTPSKLVTGRVLACSLTGISLASRDCVAGGTILNLRPIDMPAAFGLASVEVKEATQQGHQWTLVCRFIRTPPWVTRFCEPAALVQEGAKVGA
jgi:hypothetical protein